MTKSILLALCLRTVMAVTGSAQAPALGADPGVIRLNADDAPAELTYAQLVRGCASPYSESSPMGSRMKARGEVVSACHRCEDPTAS